MNFEPLKKFLIKILSANGEAADLSNVAVGFGATLTGVLGAAFAVALGVKETSGQNRGIEAFRVGPSNQLILTVGVCTYAIVGLLSTLVYAFNSDETPGSVSSLALVFVGYVAAVISNAYRAALTPP